MPRSKKTKHYFGAYYDVANEILAAPNVRVNNNNGHCTIDGIDSPFHEKYGIGRHRTVILKLAEGEIEITNRGKAPSLYLRARKNGWTFMTCDDMDSFSGFRKSHFDGMPFYAEIQERGQVVQTVREGRDIIYKDRKTDEVLYQTYCQPRWYPYPKVYLDESGTPVANAPPALNQQRHRHFGWQPEKYHCLQSASAFIGSLHEHGWRGARLSKFGDWLDQLSEELEGKLVTIKPPKGKFAALVLTGNADHLVLTVTEKFQGGNVHALYQWEPERFCAFDLNPDGDVDTLGREIGDMHAAIVQRKEARLLDTLPLC